MCESKIPLALKYFLDNNAQIKRICLYFDNDFAGRRGAEALQNILGGMYEVRYIPPPVGKDYNDYLIKRVKEDFPTHSVDGEEAKLQFRLVEGKMGKMYVTDLPEWAQTILPDDLIWNNLRQLYKLKEIVKTTKNEYIKPWALYQEALLSQELKVPVFVAESPLTCVAEGTGVLLDNIHMVDGRL